MTSSQMTTVEQRIGAYYKARGEATTGHSFLRLDPDGPFVYLFSQTPEGVNLLANRIERPRLKYRLAAVAFRATRGREKLARMLPHITKTTVHIPNSRAFDLAIASPRQVTVLAPKIGTAATIGWEDGKTDVTNEIYTRRKIPEQINTPEIQESDTTFPYFISDYIDGRTLDNPVKDWNYILDVLLQLRFWYKYNEIEVVDFNRAIEETKISLINMCGDKKIGSEIDLLYELDMPDELAIGTIHSDLHTGNILVNKEEAYILDWEHTKRDYLIRDFTSVFLQQYRETDNVTTLSQMLYKKGSGFRIAHQYANKVGETAFNSTKWYSGLVLFGLYRELLTRNTYGTSWEETREAIRTLTESL